jgi:hypothetical protein
MGPLDLDQLRGKLAAQHPERKLAALELLWKSFDLRCAFLESTGANAFAATAVAQAGVGPLREIGGMLSLQLTPFQAVTGIGVRERPDSAQLVMSVGDKEFHLPWPGALEAMLADEMFLWIIRRWSASQGAE